MLKLSFKTMKHHLRCKNRTIFMAPFDRLFLNSRGPTLPHCNVNSRAINNSQWQRFILCQHFVANSFAKPMQRTTQPTLINY